MPTTNELWDHRQNCNVTIRSRSCGIVLKNAARDTLCMPINNSGCMKLCFPIFRRYSRSGTSADTDTAPSDFFSSFLRRTSRNVSLLFNSALNSNMPSESGPNPFTVPLAYIWLGDYPVTLNTTDAQTDEFFIVSLPSEIKITRGHFWASFLSSDQHVDIIAVQ